MPLALIAGCGVLVALVMAFGNPVLWKTAEQQEAAGYAAGTDREDFAFIDEAAGEQDSLAVSQLVVRGEYKAISQDDDPDRAANIALAADSLDGLEIKPGATLSVNEALGDTVHDERYRIADAARGTKIVQERGGGICQTSTALYIAAVKAGMEIVERHPHAVVCDFAPIGLDAMLAYGEKDLRIKNASDASVFIRATALGQTVDVKVYGAALPEGDAIDAMSSIVDRSEVPASEAFDDPAAAGMAPDDSVSLYTAESYRVLYREGVKASEELLATDVYHVFAKP